MTMLKKAEFYFIRHGETDWNFEGRCMGQQNIPLNNTGIDQARKAATILRNAPIKTICYSPLLRAKKTAELINEKLNCPMIEIDDLKECCWGAFEGELKRDSKYSIENWMLGNTPEGGEDYEIFLTRALEGVNLALEYPVPLIVSHGGVYWAIQKALNQHRSIQNNGIQNCVAYYHKLIDESNFWFVESVEQCRYDEFFEI